MTSAKAALSSLEGVETVKVSYMDHKATVQMKQGAELTEEQAKAAVAKANDERGNNFSLTSFKTAD